MVEFMKNRIIGWWRMGVYVAWSIAAGLHDKPWMVRKQGALAFRAGLHAVDNPHAPPIYHYGMGKSLGIMTNAVFIYDQEPVSSLSIGGPWTPWGRDNAHYWAMGFGGAVWKGMNS